MYEWNWRIISFYKLVFVQGALVTIELTFFAVIFGTALGVAIAFLKKTRNPIFSSIAKIYIELFRAVPILVILIWIFYVIPVLFDWRISAFVAAVLALSLNLAAFVAETVRAGLESIPRNQFESGLALGMTSRQVMLKIVMPQAVRNMIPNLMGLYITELKNSSLTSIIAVNELLHRSNILISETFRPLEIYTTVAVVYLIIILPLVYLSRRIEHRLTKVDKPTFGMDYEISH
mgnify:CR=1 FL=1